MYLITSFISPNVNDWNFDEFTTFVLIYVSHADLEFSDSEKTAILGKVDRETYEKVDTYFHSLGEFERLNFILQFKPRFYPDKEGVDQLLRMIRVQFEVDGEVSKLETGLLDFLGRLL